MTSLINSQINAKFILIIVAILNLVKCEYEPSGIERLLDKIFENYNLMVRPENVNKETIVHTELKVLQIDLDEKYQELISIVWLEMSWFDDRFVWNVSEYNIEDIILPVSRIWVPDIVLQNGVGKNEYLYDMKYFNPWISHDGLVTWVPEIRIHTKCTINVANFPFDTQRCEINFYSWAHTAKQMKILQFENKNITNITHMNQNSEWYIFHTCALNKTIFTSTDLEWWTTSYVIFIKRRNYYHMFNLIVPYLILTVCSINLFLLPPETGEKISLAVSLLLTYFLNLAILSNYIPESSNELPIIATYYLFNICLIASSLAASVCVLNLYFKTSEQSTVPEWLKRLLMLKRKKKIERSSRICYGNGYHFDGDLKHAKENGSVFVNYKENKNNIIEYPLTTIKRSVDSGIYLNINHNNNNNNINKESKKNSFDISPSKQHVARVTRLNEANSNSIPILILSEKQKSSRQMKFDEFTKHLSENILQLFDDLIQGVQKKHEKIIMEKLNQTLLMETKATGCNNDWRDVGHRVDQLLFVFSVIVVILSQAFFFWTFYSKNLLPKCNACHCSSSH